MAIKLNKIADRIARLQPTVAALQHTPGATRRVKGPPAQKRNARWLLHHPICAKCLETGEDRAAVEIDHIIPLWKGGPDDETNIQGLCVDHHKEKSAAEARERYGSMLGPKQNFQP